MKKQAPTLCGCLLVMYIYSRMSLQFEHNARHGGQSDKNDGVDLLQGLELQANEHHASQGDGGPSKTAASWGQPTPAPSPGPPSHGTSGRLSTPEPGRRRSGPWRPDEGRRTRVHRRLSRNFFRKPAMMAMTIMAGQISPRVATIPPSTPAGVKAHIGGHIHPHRARSGLGNGDHIG